MARLLDEPNRIGLALLCQGDNWDNGPGSRRLGYHTIQSLPGSKQASQSNHGDTEAGSRKRRRTYQVVRAVRRQWGSGGRPTSRSFSATPRACLCRAPGFRRCAASVSRRLRAQIDLLTARRAVGTRHDVEFFCSSALERLSCILKQAGCGEGDPRYPSPGRSIYAATRHAQRQIRSTSPERPLLPSTSGLTTPSSHLDNAVLSD